MEITPSLIRRRNRIAALFPRLVLLWEQIYFARKVLPRYEKEGFAPPLPAILKRAVIRKAALDNNCKILVETGTYAGNTPWNLKELFVELHTIEISPILVQLAKERFANIPQVHVHEGDSGSVLSQVVPNLTASTLFWLDGHYSGGVTGRTSVKEYVVFRELETIFSSCKVPYVILIDDARCFGTDEDYPSIEALRDFVARKNNALKVHVESDIIYLV